MIDTLNLNIVDEKATQLAALAHETKECGLALTVRSPREYEQVSVFLAAVKAKFNAIEGHRKHLKEPFLEGGRRVDEFFRAPLDALRDAEDFAKRQLLNYQTAQQIAAAEESRRLEEKARREREALEEKARKEREKADAEAAELERQADAAREAGNLAQAVTLRNQAGRLVEKSEAKAEALQSRAEQVTAPVVTAYVPPIVGQSVRTVWKARVTDAHAVPREYLMVNEKVLNQVAAATNGKLTIPGVEFYAEQSLSARAQR